MKAIAAVVAAAVERGLLPPAAAHPAGAERPWPLVLLAALGAWLAAIPLLIAFGMLFGHWVVGDVGGYLVGALMLAGVVLVLRSAALPTFVEHLGTPLLLTAAGILGLRLFTDLPSTAAALVLMALALAVAAIVPRPWLRQLLGAAAALLLVTACAGTLPRPGDWRIGAGCYVALAAWLAVQPLVGAAGADTVRRRMALEAVAGGWAAALLAALAAQSGWTLLIGAGQHPLWIGGTGRAAPGPVLPLLSAAAAIFAGTRIASRWPGFRRPVFAAIGLVLATLAAFMPMLGAALTILAIAALGRRTALATAAAAAALWILGAFYYRLHWPLAEKALLLAGAGLVLGLLARFAGRPPAAAAAATASPGRRFATAGLALTLVGVLLVVNLAIRDKEALIAAGRPVFVELAPVDPRSLIQGDYMRLDFRLPAALRNAVGRPSGASRPRLVAGLDARGVATARRVDDGTPLADDELRIELTPKNGRWILVSDAWFFREGDAARWQAARYGEFRVAADGRALLVGMADRDLRAIR